jgi:putative ABC transport system substrate-binding protein
MRRREFIALLGSATVAVPIAARAQQPGQLFRLGYLSSNSEDEQQAQSYRIAFHEALGSLGWAEGRTIRIDYRWGAATPERARAYAEELVTLKPNALLATNSTCSEALQKTTKTVPIVFTNVSDPLGSGLVDSMAHPGGNVTGFTNYEFNIGGKWLEILKEVDHRGPDIMPQSIAIM